VVPQAELARVIPWSGLSVVMGASPVSTRSVFPAGTLSLQMQRSQAL